MREGGRGTANVGRIGVFCVKGEELEEELEIFDGELDETFDIFVEELEIFEELDGFEEEKEEEWDSDFLCLLNCDAISFSDICANSTPLLFAECCVDEFNDFCSFCDGDEASEWISGFFSSLLFVEGAGM